MKITFLGDIMIEPPVLKAAKQPDGSYNFDGVFKYVTPMLEKSDFVVGNLETPLAGEEAGYTDTHLAFNAPDTYVDACMKAGIDLLSTANNHTFDRGYEGMIRTIRVMDEKGIAHIGSYLPGTERPEAHYAEIGGTKIAVIAYTYDTNYGGSGGQCLAEGEYAGTVNLLRPQGSGTYLPGVMRGKDWVDKMFTKWPLRSFKDANVKGQLKKHLGMVATYSRADDKINEETNAPYIAQMQADIRKAKEKADLVFFYPHVGGQFNEEPGAFSKFIFEKALEAGADAIIGTHSHIPQKMVMEGNVPCAYCLGNFNMNPNSYLAMPEILTQYNFAMHLYVEDKKLEKVTFTMMVNFVDKDGQICSYPLHDLYPTLKGKQQEALMKDARKLHLRITGRPMKGKTIREEYAL